MEVGVGLPCSNDALCHAIGWGFAALGLLIVGVFVGALWSEWRKTKR